MPTRLLSSTLLLSATLFAVLTAVLYLSGSSTPIAEAGSPTATQVAVGRYHTCAITGGGSIQCWGFGGDGEMGNGSDADQNTPVAVTGIPSGATQIDAGYYHNCAVVNGGAKCWGYDGDGELGDGTTGGSACFCRELPTSVSGLTNGVLQVATGAYHSCALTDSHGVKCWGFNFMGQLGDGSRDDSSTPVDVTGLTSGVESISAGDYFTCAVTSGGGVTCWGDNYYGELGDGTFTSTDCLCQTQTDVVGLSNITALFSGANSSCAITEEGGLKCWGDNYFGQLGDGSTENRASPVGVTGLASGVTSVGVGGSFVCAVVNGTTECWGANYAGQLGDGSVISHTSPQTIESSGGASTQGIALPTVDAGNYHACIAQAGSAQCWGYAAYGEIGNASNGAQKCDCVAVPATVFGIGAVGNQVLDPPPPPPADIFANTDMTAAGRGGMRDNGNGNIVLTGVSGTVTKALLFWQGPEGIFDNGTSALGQGISQDVNFNGNAVTGANIGKASSNCWGPEESDAYRADVTSLVSGNGTYTLSGFEAIGAQASGASLIVFFDDGNDANNHDVLLWEGNDSNDDSSFDPTGWNMWMGGFNYSGGAATLTLHVADGQTFDEGRMTVNGDQIKPAGPIFDGDSVPSDASSASTHDGGLWDIVTYNVAGALGGSANDINLKMQKGDDCDSLVAAALSLSVGSVASSPLLGDNDCSGSVTPADGLPVLDFLGGFTPTSTQGDCPHVGSSFGSGLWGDVDCSGEIDGHDLLLLLAYSAGTYVQPPSCGKIGDQILLG
ncbi:MAG: hypothetical protein ABI559_04105 [Chloroflexota bacterium]